MACEHEPLRALKHLRVSSPPVGGAGQVWSVPAQVCGKCGVVYVEKRFLEEAAMEETDA